MTDLPPMRTYPVPMNEHARSRMTAAMEIDKRRDDPFFEHVTDMVREIFGTPVAYLSLFVGDEQAFLCMNGSDLTGTPRTLSLCAFTVARRTSIIIPDTHLDARTVAHPIVTEAPHLRFSASAPVCLASGFCLGTICAVDFVPHADPGVEKVRQLEHLAAMVARFYEVPLEPDPAHLARLEQIAGEAQEEFLALIGHELRTPLNGISGLTQIFEPADAEQAELLGVLSETTNHLERIVESILRFTDLRSGHVALSEAPVDLGDMLVQVCANMSRLAEVRGKSLVLGDIPAGLGVRGDAALLELAVTCLLHNFVAHGGNAGRIVLRDEQNGDLTLDILDNGPGIAADRMAAVWRAFAVGADPKVREADGLGLGLPLSSRIVEMHGGELDLHQEPGLTASRIRLPAWRRATKAAAIVDANHAAPAALAG